MPGMQADSKEVCRQLCCETHIIRQAPEGHACCTQRSMPSDGVAGVDAEVTAHYDAAEKTSPTGSTAPGQLQCALNIHHVMPCTATAGDVLQVHEVAAEAIARARRGDGPTLIEAQTYRFRGHSLADPDELRPKAEKEKWQVRAR